MVQRSVAQGAYCAPVEFKSALNAAKFIFVTQVAQLLLVV